MVKVARLLLVIALAAPGAALAKSPVLVELFTAQGCSSCGKVEAIVDQLADRPGVVVLTWPVDYWDYLGWKDTFAQPQFTDRQRAYDRRMGLRDVYTPQVIVDGRLQASGATAGGVEALIKVARAARRDDPDMEFLGSDRVAVGSGIRLGDGAEVWLIRFDPKVSEVEVKGGDNRGETVHERNVVREVELLGRWRGRPVVFKASAGSDEGLETLIVVQGIRGGRVLGVLQQEPTKAAAPDKP